MGYTEGKWLISSSFLVVTKEAKIIANTFVAEGIKSFEIPIKESIANARLITSCCSDGIGLKLARLLIERLDNIEIGDSVRVSSMLIKCVAMAHRIVEDYEKKD